MTNQPMNDSLRQHCDSIARQVEFDTTKAKAQVLWENMNKSQRTGVRFGLFPHEIMTQAESEGFNAHQLCVALMDVAQKNGGMIA